ncbi:MAG: LysM peptidoglycan-binding domain-containing protein [Candidatus Omnitrophica bacterium]|nr:LysM peptidoglycan-binding domain-containing protein [Candidatus Omnitrophota bacterium]
MKQLSTGLMAAVVGFAITGCARVSTQVVEKPRVDQELASGNRGFLVGSAPQSGERKTTRQIFQADIEMATAKELTPWKVQKGQKTVHQSPQAAVRQPVVPQQEPSASGTIKSWDEPVESVAAVPAPASSQKSGTIYTVKKGDTLEKIAARFYGDGSRWRPIYEANRDTLKSPNKIFPGQKLVIPAGSQAQKKAASQSEWK